MLSFESFSFTDSPPIHVDARMPGFDQRIGEASPGTAKKAREQLAGDGAQPPKSMPAAAVAGTDPLVACLWQFIYRNVYTRHSNGATGKTPSSSSEAFAQQRTDPSFLRTLRSANPGRKRWDAKWRVYQLGAAGAVHVQKGEAYRLAVPGEYAFAQVRERPITVGDLVEVLAPADSPTAQPGYYFLHGETLASEFDDAEISRLYLHVRPEAAAQLVGLVASELNRFDVPFRLKCPSAPESYGRADAGVLYVARRFLQATLHILERSWCSLGAMLNPGAPLFTKEIEPGFAGADDPGTGESFGQSRCRLVAEAIVDAWLKGSQTPEARLTALQERFSGAGLSLEAPHLNAGAVDEYCWPCGASEVGVPKERVNGSLAPSDTASTRGVAYLDAADRIGRRLCRDAVWWQERCNWLGWSTEPVAGSVAILHRACSPALYNGVAGIAWFLANLQRLTGDRAQKAAMNGAVRQLMASHEGWSGEGAQSYFAGVGGVGYMLTRIDALCGGGDLVGLGLQLMKKAGRTETDASKLDVMMGSAGLVPALVDAGQRLGEPELIEMALRHGEAILQHASFTPDGVSWAGPVPGGKQLVGFSHGAAGFACALFELYRVSGDRRFLDVAMGALRYERNSFSPAHLNWPDYREKLPGAPEGLPYPVAWCHGAAGIGVSRLRIRRLLGEDTAIRDELQAAAATVSASVQIQENQEPADFSLCHGMAGNADFLLMLADESSKPEVRAIAAAVGDMGIERFHLARAPWPCGVGGAGETPNLMLGLAGIGYFYLRLYDSKAIDSVLIVQPSYLR